MIFWVGEGVRVGVREIVAVGGGEAVRVEVKVKLEVGV